MRKLGLLVLGVAIGAVTVALGTRTDAQSRAVESMEELNARFAVSDWVTVRNPDQLPYNFRFFRDRRTSDCYITYRTGKIESGVLTKTDDNACDGF